MTLIEKIFNHDKGFLRPVPKDIPICKVCGKKCGVCDVVIDKKEIADNIAICLIHDTWYADMINFIKNTNKPRYITNERKPKPSPMLIKDIPTCETCGRQHKVIDVVFDTEGDKNKVFENITVCSFCDGWGKELFRKIEEVGTRKI